MNKFLQLALNASQKSADILIKKYHKFNRHNVQLKSRHEILTENDLLSEKIIIQEIKKSFPEHSILSEEKGQDNKKSDYLWLIDPIDGTTNFSIHNPLWAISIALAYQEKIIMGLVYAPILKEKFAALNGQGAYLNNKKINVSDIQSGKIINAFCHGNKIKDIERAIKYYQKQKLNHLDCRQLGSASLELSYVASGRIESIIIPGVNAYDVAGGALILREAGGKITDFSGNKWNLSSPDICATNKKVHSLILKGLKNI